jgi:hypothetical protein
MRPLVLLFTSLISLVGTASQLHAQSRQPARRASAPEPRRIYASFGLGGGSAALTCPFCTNELKPSFSGVVSFETPFRRGMLLGVDIPWWRYSGGGGTRTVVGAIPAVHFFPWSPRRAFLKAGFGLARYAASSAEEELHTMVFAFTLGAGVETRLSARYALIPYLTWVKGGGGTMRLNGEPVTERSGISLLQYGVAVALR